ncbi:MAG: efflux RND transporter periplasmic adaptor subunit [Candidatus Kapabacteria bacterium]|jgi:membrane fusion protein (multidrug efflux system)|nr:efflux RND transporter periplasmic adaptor subunit [Candidatus Kapabacteria bacterium]
MNKSNLKKIGLWSLVLVVALVIILPKFLGDDDAGKIQPDAGKNNSEMKPLKVNGIIAKFEKLDNSVFSSGTILSDEEIELKTEVSGKITKLNINEGGYVKKGSLLVKLNDNDLQAQLKKATERLKLLELTESRQKLLFEKQGISKQDYDISLSELSTQKAEIEYVKSMIDRTEIKAPFDGIIGLRYVSVGAYITPNNTIASLQKIDFLKIDFAVPQKYFNNIQKGSALRFRVPPDTIYHYVNVFATEPKIDQQTRTFKIRGKFNNSGKKLLPGSYAEIFVTTDEKPNSVLIPSISLVPDIESEYVLVHNNGKAMRRNVRTGVRTTDMIEITSGIFPGDTVITSGIMQLKPGAPVEVSITK